MHTIHLIEPLRFSPHGPLAGTELVHLRQGDADGACGPYCVLMALLASGLARRDAAVRGEGVDSRTRMGRVWSTFSRWGPLVCQGTDERGIEEVLEAFGPSVAFEFPRNYGRRSVNRFIVQQLEANHPVVIGIDCEEKFSHWVLAVGLDSGNNELDAERLLILDPGLDASPVAAWNGIIELTTERRRFPSRCWDSRGESRCAIETAIAVQATSSGVRVG